MVAGTRTAVARRPVAAAASLIHFIVPDRRQRRDERISG
jgi:hypothetical protein